MATKNAKSKEVVLEPVVTKGSHLTVTKYPDGRTDLVWDHDALLREVQIATGDRKVSYIDAGNLSPEDAVKLVKTVEKKIAAKRAPAKKKVTK